MIGKLILQLLLTNLILADPAPIFSPGTDQRPGSGAPADSVIIYPEQDQGIVSPLIMGFNSVYCYAPDKFWDSRQGSIPKRLQQLGTRILRYPAGTVVTFFHWEHPTGQGWKDSWDPLFDPARNTPPSSFMDVDEYLDLCLKFNIEPLMGINMASGKKYNRVQEGIEEAKRLMLHCRKKGLKVTYYYLDNEPYHENANYTFTAEEYAGMVNLYAAEMKKIDKDIRIIVNTHPRNLTYTRTLIKEAGENINYIDIHYYWKWGNATYENWQSEPVMRQGKGLTYKQQRSFYRELSASLGFPEIDLVSLEWNIGQTGKGNRPPTGAEAALMIGEQFMQFIQSGMPMATFWTTTWPKVSGWDNRLLLDAQNSAEPNKVFHMFALFKNILGQSMVHSESSGERIIPLSIKSLDNDTLWVYLINKQASKNPSLIVLNPGNFGYSQFKAGYFSASDSSNGELRIEKPESRRDPRGKLILQIPAYSMAKVTLIK